MFDDFNKCEELGVVGDASSFNLLITPDRRLGVVMLKRCATNCILLGLGVAGVQMSLRLGMAFTEDLGTLGTVLTGVIPRFFALVNNARFINDCGVRFGVRDLGLNTFFGVLTQVVDAATVTAVEHEGEELSDISTTLEESVESTLTTDPEVLIVLTTSGVPMRLTPLSFDFFISAEVALIFRALLSRTGPMEAASFILPGVVKSIKCIEELDFLDVVAGVEKSMKSKLRSPLLVFQGVPPMGGCWLRGVLGFKTAAKDFSMRTPVSRGENDVITMSDRPNGMKLLISFVSQIFSLLSVQFIKSTFGVSSTFTSRDLFFGSGVTTLSSLPVSSMVGTSNGVFPLD